MCAYLISNHTSAKTKEHRENFYQMRLRMRKRYCEASKSSRQKGGEKKKLVAIERVYTLHKKTTVPAELRVCSRAPYSFH